VNLFAFVLNTPAARTDYMGLTGCCGWTTVQQVDPLLLQRQDRASIPHSYGHKALFNAGSDTVLFRYYCTYGTIFSGIDGS